MGDPGSSVCFSGLMRRPVREEGSSLSWREVNSGFMLQNYLKSTHSFLVSSSSSRSVRQNHVIEMPPIGLDL